MLRKNKEHFEQKNLATDLQIEAKDVGKIFKIRIGHDGSGIGSGWFLETVDVKHLIMALVPKEKKKEDKKKKKKKKKDEEDEDEEGGEEMREVALTYHFPCSRWLAEGEEDGELVVELLPEDGEDLEGIEYIKYNVQKYERIRSGYVANEENTMFRCATPVKNGPKS